MQEKVRTAQLAESMKKMDAEMKRTDALLYQMIPKSVADRLRKGEPAMSTCQVYLTEPVFRIVFSNTGAKLFLRFIHMTWIGHPRCDWPGHSGVKGLLKTCTFYDLFGRYSKLQ